MFPTSPRTGAAAPVRMRHTHPPASSGAPAPCPPRPRCPPRPSGPRPALGRPPCGPGATALPPRPVKRPQAAPVSPSCSWVPPAAEKEKGLATSYFPALLNAVSSPRRPFTVVFGMGTGVTSSLKSPVQKDGQVHRQTAGAGGVRAGRTPCGVCRRVRLAGSQAAAPADAAPVGAAWTWAGAAATTEHLTRQR